MRSAKSLSNRLVMFISCVFFALSIWFFTARVQYFFRTVRGYHNGKIALVELGCLLLVLVAFFAGWPYIKNKMAKIKEWIKGLSVPKMLLIIVLVCFVPKVILLFVLQIDSSQHADIYYYWEFIKQLTNFGEISQGNPYDVSSLNHLHTLVPSEYAHNYSYTVVYATFFLPFTKLFGANNILLCNFYLIILCTVASVLLFDTVKYIANKNYAFFAVILWTIMPAAILQPLYLCHENAFIILNILALWLLFRVLPVCKHNISKILTIAAAALVLSYLSKINQFGKISIIAIVIVCVIQLFCKKINRHKIKQITIALLTFLFVFMATGLLINMYTEKVIANPPETTQTQNELPYGWPLYDGMSYKNQGWWSTEDYNNWYQYLNMDNKEEAINYQKELLKERTQWYLQNPLRIPLHLNNKMTTITQQFLSFKGEDQNSKAVTFIRSAHNGYLYYFILCFVALINILVSFVLVISFKKSRVDKHFYTYLKLLLIGVCLVLLVVEVNSKYPTILLPFYLTITALQLKDFVANMDWLHAKVKALLPRRNK